MLPKANRLTKKAEFKEVLSRGKTIQGRLFTLKYLEKEPEFPTKVGIIVSKKIAKRAVYRNKARRRLKEVLRNYVKSLNPGLNMAFLVKREILEAKYTDIRQEVETTLQKL